MTLPLRRAAVIATLAAIALSGCGSDDAPDSQYFLGEKTAQQDGWTWGLKVDSGEVSCQEGITGPEIGFTPTGSNTNYALSSNARIDAQMLPDTTKYTVELDQIWDGGSPFRNFLDRAWQICGYQDAPDDDAQLIMGDGYQP